ncbi:hypothetical protein MJT46_011297, partial [Ovis ammon polii x Ovis aries]
FLKEKEEYCPKFIKFIIRKLSGGCNVLIVTTTTDVICYFNSPSMGLAPGHILDVVETWIRFPPLNFLLYLLLFILVFVPDIKLVPSAGQMNTAAATWALDTSPQSCMGGKGMTLKLPYEKNVACESRTPNNFIITLRFPELHVFIEVNNGGIMNDIHYLLYNTQPLKVTTAIIFTSFLTYTHRAAQVCARYLLQISPPTSCQRKACCYPTEAHDSAGPFGHFSSCAWGQKYHQMVKINFFPMRQTLLSEEPGPCDENAEHRPGSMVPPGKRVQTCNVVIWTGRRLQSAPEGGLRPGRDRSGGKDADVDAAPCAVCTVTLWTECQESWGFDLGASYQKNLSDLPRKFHQNFDEEYEADAVLWGKLTLCHDPSPSVPHGIFFQPKILWSSSNSNGKERTVQHALWSLADRRRPHPERLDAYGRHL